MAGKKHQGAGAGQAEHGRGPKALWRFLFDLPVGCVKLALLLSCCLWAYRIRLAGVHIYGYQIHGYDPTFNWHAARYLAKHGWHSEDGKGTDTAILPCYVFVGGGLLGGLRRDGLTLPQTLVGTPPRDECARGVVVSDFNSLQSTRRVRMGIPPKGTLASLLPGSILGNFRWPRPARNASK
ncbi:unnamed protein product [Prorocentrum cordatum]|uniref:Mannosyltransferase n=1 Tax=Prorocentrum cordatum TaxID=2364126 RepID=A0ABN9QXP3_9DINO|nr:unnamed protein product [Polarella glacialis]